jgi:Transposase
VREHDDPKSGVPTAVFNERDQEDHMGVIIGVDPHKGSHTAVAIGRDEMRLATVKVRATRRQVDQLLEWAARFEERTWAIESAGGLGYLLAQQLLGAGETVLDVPATLAARVRVLGTGRSNKNDPNDAHSVAVAALRAPRLSPVARADIAAITQIRFRHSPGRAFFERKVAEGKTKKEAVRALKRRIADAVYRQLLIDARTVKGPGGQPGTALQSSVADSTPRRPALRISHSRARTNARTPRAPRRTPTSSRARTPSAKHP